MTTIRNISQLLQISRPRFWLYEAGTFFLGVLIAVPFAAASLPLLLWWGFYFLVPANLLIYGVNDVYDYETDLRNPKKQSYEAVLPKERHRFVLLAILLTNIPFLLGAWFLSVQALVALGLFIGCAWFYSVPPIRAKARPFLDSLFSAGHYVATGVFGFLLVAPGVPVQPLFVIAALAWATAMHVYSAIPDISADQAAALETTAAKLGQTSALWYCFGLYTLAAVLTAPATAYVTLGLLLPYLVILRKSVGATENELLRLYRWFPAINTLVGGVLSVQAILRVL